MNKGVALTSVSHPDGHEPYDPDANIFIHEGSLLDCEIVTPDEWFEPPSFTLEEWRLIAIACIAAPQGKFQDSTAVSKLKKMAISIAEYTGRFSDAT